MWLLKAFVTFFALNVTLGMALAWIPRLLSSLVH